MDLKQVEELMKPSIMSSAGFLGPNEKLIEVLAEDEATVKKLGLTHEKIAARIEYFILAVKAYPTREGQIVDENFKVRGTAWRGGQECPWKDTKAFFGGSYSNADFIVENLKLKEIVAFPGLIVHLIREHHFYEGKESPYRVDPKKLARVLEIH